MNVIITGASRGIGKALAEIFAANGHSLFLCSRTEQALQQTANELRKLNPAAGVKARVFDLGRKENAIEFGKWCLGFAVPDILVNNAGIFEPGSVYNEPDGLIDSQLAINFLSAYHLTRTVLPPMMERRSGQVFNICSVASLHAYADGGAYSISKHALYGFSRNLREEMKPYGIRVSSIHPGAVLTGSWGDFDNTSGRIMEAGDIAKLVYTISQLSPQACVEDLLIRPQLGDL